MVNLTPANLSDSAGAQAILDAFRRRWPWVKHLFADAAYDRLKLMDKAAYLDFVVEIIRRSDDQQGCEVLARRWAAERTVGGMMRWRRLVRDYERRIDVSHAMILVARGGNLLRATPTRDFPNGLLVHLVLAEGSPPLATIPSAVHVRNGSGLHVPSPC